MLQMNTEMKKKLAYDLTLEYVHQNNLLQDRSENHIEDKIKLIKNKYDGIIKAVENNF